MLQPSSTQPITSDSTLVVLIPVFNDWEALARLLPALDVALAGAALEARVLVVDDASTAVVPDALLPPDLTAVSRVDVLALGRNLGHQRALAVGLSYVAKHVPCRAVVVMDGDGEDDPRDVPRLVRKFEEEGGRSVVFAERMRRAEGPVFRACYWLYRAAHRLLTGIPVRVGNFSVVPRAALERLVVASELWNHFAASVHKIRLPFVRLPTDRARRLTGESRMSFVSLVIHGLSAISVFGDRVGVRMLVATVAAMALAAGLLFTTCVLRFATNLAIPGWATSTAGLLLVLLTQMFLASLAFVFLILHGRDSSSVIPLRDFHYYVAGVRELARERAHAPADLTAV